MAFTPFLQSAEAQNIISNYLGGGYQAQPNLNSAGMWRNPQFDIRTQQELAGELDPSALYANPIMDWSATSTEEEIVDPCPVGYQLINGVCQPNEKFGQSMYNEGKDDKKDPDPREYYSIEDMEKMNDYEFLDYLTGAGSYMTGKDGMYTLNNPMMSSASVLASIFGLNSSDIRNKYMREKLAKLGYNFTNNKQGEPVYDLIKPMGIINNAQSANQLMTGDQQFDSNEINYQIDQQNNSNQGNYQAPQMTQDQVIADAVASGATSFNPFEAFGINQSTPTQPQNNTPMNVGNPLGYDNNPKPPFLS